MRIAATIPSGATGLSAAIDLVAGRIVGIEMSAAWVAAGITFQVSMDGTNYFDLRNDAGTEVAITTDAARIIGFRGDLRSILEPFRYMKLRSGTSGTPVDQTASRALFLYCE